MQKKSSSSSGAHRSKQNGDSLKGAQKPRPPQTRRAAANMLAAIERGKTLDEAMDRLDNLSPANRGLARAMVMFALRHRGEIEALLTRFLKRAVPPSPHIAKALLHIGVVQMCYMDVPDHAAVAETVNACGRQEAPYRGLINAVLRNLSRQTEAARMPPDNATLNMPDWMMAQWVETYGAATAQQIAEQHRHKPPLDLCFKTAAGAQQFMDSHSKLQEAESEAEESERKSERARLKMAQIGATHIRLYDAPHVETLSGFKQGDWWIQDFAASLPAQMLMAALLETGLLEIGENKTPARILDLCAAPGGKTMQLAAGGYEVTALDISGTRLKRLRENLNRTGLNANIIEADALKWQPPAAAPETQPEPFDAILLDAPCSATGTIRRHPDLPLHRRHGYTDKLIILQDALLDRAANWLKAGGLLGYATCSLDPAEGEERIAAFLKRHPHFTCVPIEADIPSDLITQNMLRTTPANMADKGGMDGFFSVVLQWEKMA